MKIRPDYPPKSNKQETAVEKFKKIFEAYVTEVNSKYKAGLGCDLLDSSGRIRLNAFERGVGGPYRKTPDKTMPDSEEETIQDDKKKIVRKELEFSGANNSDIQNRYGVPGQPEEAVKRWREEKEKNINTRAEAVITFLLHKFLGERFLIARASEFDDYENGVDTLVIDKNTGEVIGAFDEVLDSWHQDEVAAEKSKKYEKVKDKNIKGGAEVKYGLTFFKKTSEEKPTPVRQKLLNVPIFFLSLTKVDFERTLGGIDADLEKNPNVMEKEIFVKLLNSLKEQAALLKKERIPGNVLAKIEKFEGKIDKLLEE